MNHVKSCEFLKKTENGRWYCYNSHRCDMPCKSKDPELVTPENRDDFVVCPTRLKIRR